MREEGYLCARRVLMNVTIHFCETLGSLITSRIINFLAFEK